MRVRKYIDLTGGDRYFISDSTQTAYIVGKLDFESGKSSECKVADAHRSVKRFTYDNFPGDDNTIQVWNNTIPVSVELDKWQEYRPVQKTLS